MGTFSKPRPGLPGEPVSGSGAGSDDAELVGELVGRRENWAPLHRFDDDGSDDGSDDDG